MQLFTEIYALQLKKSMKKFSKIFFSIFLIFSSLPVFSQSDAYEEVFQLAKKLEESGATNEAFVEYKRYIFLQDYSEGIHQKEAYLALSLMYKNVEKYTKSIEYLQLAQNYDSSEALRFEEIEILRQLSCQKKYYLENNLSLFNYRNQEGYSEELKQTAWKAILENEVIREDFELFELNFTKVCQDFPKMFTEEQIQSINNSLAQIMKFKPKNPTVALWLSIIPGLGQLYAGNPKDALNAFLLDGSLIALSTFTILSGDYIDFGLFELDPTLRFYRGNLYNAQKEVYEYNEEKMLKLKSPILEILK